MTYHTRQPYEPNTTPDEIERLLHHMPTVAALAENEWAKTFATSILRQSRRRGWRPSPKQEAMMRRLVADLFAGTDEEMELIEE